MQARRQDLNIEADNDQLSTTRLADIDVCLRQADLDDTVSLFEKQYDAKYEQKLIDYFTCLYNATPRDINTLCYEVPYSGLHFKVIQWQTYLREKSSKNIKNTPDVSKDMYEEIAFNNFEIKFDAIPRVLLKNNRPVLTTAWNQNLLFVDHIRRGLRSIGEIESVLEVGCGEGKIPFTLSLCDPDFFDNTQYVAFDYSFFRVLKADRLLRTYFQRRGIQSPIKLYNGDATKLAHKDKQFDAVVTNCVLEQIKYRRDSALSEMARVAKYMVITEPVYDYQTRFAKAHLARCDYVRLELSDLKKVGEIVSVTVHELQNPTYGYVTVVLRCHQ